MFSLTAVIVCWELYVEGKGSMDAVTDFYRAEEKGMNKL